MTDEILAAPQPVEVVPLASVEELMRATERELAQLERVAFDVIAAADDVDDGGALHAEEDRWARIRAFREEAEEAARRDAETLIELAQDYARRKIATARAATVLHARAAGPSAPAAPFANAAEVTAPAPRVAVVEEPLRAPDPEPSPPPAPRPSDQTAPTAVVTVPTTGLEPRRDDDFWSSASSRKAPKQSKQASKRRGFPVPALLEVAAVLLILVFILLRLS